MSSLTWQLGAAANGITACAYFMISWSIARALVRAGEFRSNRLGAATALIFFTCGVHHGGHTVHALLPMFGIKLSSAYAVRQSFDLASVSWDLLTAGVGLYYWTQRRSYGRLLEGGQLFEDQHRRLREALDINDGIVQGIVAAQLAKELGRSEEVDAALSATLEASRQMVMRLLSESSVGGVPEAGDLIRSHPASLS